MSDASPSSDPNRPGVTVLPRRALLAALGLAPVAGTGGRNQRQGPPPPRG